MPIGLFIVLEGIDGSGKTSIATSLKKKLLDNDYKVVITREPTFYESGVLLRKYLNMFRLDQRDPIYEALLFAADRIYHINTFIKPLIRKGYIVICDRYVYSSIVYQSTDGVPEEWIKTINKYIIQPDLAFFIDVEPVEALARIKNKVSMFEDKSFLEKVYLKYKDMVKKGILIPVKGKRSINKITEEIYNMVISKWREKNYL